MEIFGSRHHCQLARRHYYLGLFCLLPVGILLGGVGRGVGGAGLFGERVGRDL